MKIKVVLPFRLREGGDFRRSANLAVTQAWWYAHGFDPIIQSDGLSGDAQFNRHRAYNAAVARFPETEVFVFTEADMLIYPEQVRAAVFTADANPGLVVPFTQYRYLSDEVTARVRDTYYDDPAPAVAALWELPPDDPESLFQWEAERVIDNGDSIGAINVVSRRTLEMTGGFTEATSGNWYDDNIIEEGFRFLTGNPTRWVAGPALHLYHLPGWKGDHLTEADRAATQHNKRLLHAMRADVKQGNRLGVKTLMSVRDLTGERS